VFYIAFIMLLSDGVVINQASLDEVGLVRPGYGFTLEDHIYLGYSTNIVKFDKDGNMVAVFNQKGHGPREMRMGGPIFPFKNTVWVYDVKNKMVILDLDLSYKNEIDLRFDDFFYIFPISNGKLLFSLEVHPSANDFDASIQWRHSKDFTVSRKKSLDLSATSPLDIGVAYLGNDHIAYFLKAFTEERYMVSVWSHQDGSEKKYHFLAPDFNLKIGDRRNKKAPFELMKKVPYINSVGLINNRLLVFLERFVGKRGSMFNVKYFVVEFDLESKQQLGINEVGYRLIPSPGPSDHLLYHHPEIGIELTPR